MSLAQRWAEDRPILAEICAIYQLLCVEEVQGKKRLGGRIEIAVSFAAIRKALNKDALKTTQRGGTEKCNVALSTKFLATKYFEANVVAEGQVNGKNFRAILIWSCGVCQVLKSHPLSVAYP